MAASSVTPESDAENTHKSCCYMLTLVEENLSSLPDTAFNPGAPHLVANILEAGAIEWFKKQVRREAPDLLKIISIVISKGAYHEGGKPIPRIDFTAKYTRSSL